MIRRTLLLLAMGAAQFAVFETALRLWGHSEASPAFQTLFMQDPTLGYRLRPNARTRFVTAEFDTNIAINAQGVRDDADIGIVIDGHWVSLGWVVYAALICALFVV